MALNSTNTIKAGPSPSIISSDTMIESSKNNTLSNAFIEDTPEKQEVDLTNKSTKDSKINSDSFFKDYKKSKRSFVTLQKWEGKVVSINTKQTTFKAILTDLTNGGTDEEVELDFYDLSSDEDVKALEEGKVFYWHIGYEYINSTRKKASLILLRRFKSWDSVDEAEDKTDQLFNWINNNASH